MSHVTMLHAAKLPIASPRFDTVGEQCFRCSMFKPSLTKEWFPVGSITEDSVAAGAMDASSPC